MKAIILCAGYGKRMKPYTNYYQKTMIPIHGKPLLEYVIEGIKETDISQFIIVVGYQKEQIIDYFKSGEDWDISIEYIDQNSLNGTGGALLLCESYIKENHLFLTWGDILVSYRIYKKVMDVFNREGVDFILVGNLVSDPYRGAAIYCSGDFCSDIVEKPPKGTSRTNLNNAGIFILSRRIFDILKIQEPSNRGEIELPQAIRTGIKDYNWKCRVIKMQMGEFHGDFGNISEYEQLKSNDKWLKDL
jgi:NDP-sugar pyrophosphorylase family protein